MPDSKRSRLLATAIAASLILVTIGAIVSSLYQAYESEVEGWTNQLNNTSLLLAEATSHEMVSAKLILESMQERIKALAVQDVNDLHAKLGSESEYQRLVERKSVSPQIDVATIVDMKGDVVNFSRSFPAPAINLSERDYFQALRAGSVDDTYYSAPVRNKGNGTWTFYVSRRIEDARGRFAGVVLVGVSCGRLTEFFRKINLGDDAAVTLYRSDFTLLARWPHIDAMMGRVNKQGSTFEVIAQKKLDSGVVIVKSPRLAQNGQPIVRMGAVRRIPNAPLIINVTVTEDLYLEQWRQFALHQATIGAICCLAIVAGFAVLLKESQRREAAIKRGRELQAQADLANRAKSDFLALMSHEMRTPLTAVIGFAEQVEQSTSLADAREMGAIIVRNGHHLLALINDILDMSKIESGKLHLEKVPFSPSEALDAIAVLMQGQASRRGIGFITSVAAPLPKAVLGDPMRWRQILQNLVSNAIKFTERGEVRMSLSYDAQRTLLVCCVADTGIGISEQQQAKLFAPFVQAEDSVAGRFGGTGLGLYLVRQLATAMGGDVTLRSAPGQGTTITVTAQLPPAAASAKGGELAAPAAPPEGASAPQLAGTVLLVEDGADNRRLISALLQRCGLKTVCAADGKEGLALARSVPVDLVLMDVRMPVMDGVTATMQLRAGQFTRPIVALTANIGSEDRRRYMAAGFNDCVAKPIDRAEFQSVLERYLPLKLAQPAASFADLPEFAALRQAFQASLAPRIDSIIRHLNKPDLASVMEEAHILKGSAATFGFPDCGKAAAGIEAACRAGDAAAAQYALSNLLSAAWAESAVS